MYFFYVNIYFRLLTIIFQLIYKHKHKLKISKNNNDNYNYKIKTFIAANYTNILPEIIKTIVKY